MSTGAAKTTNVKVAVRCRPFIDKEVRDKCKCIIKMDGPQTTISSPSGNRQEAKFTYDHCYFQDVSSRKVYEDLGLPLLKKAMEGYNATIFAYGQTGSGKTYCMTGSESEPGIIPMMNADLFKHIESAPPSNKFLVTVSYLEIYQEDIHDLLNPHGKDMKVREHPQLGIYVEGLAELVVKSGSDIARLQEQGNRVRKVAATEMNQRSSRSHSVFTLHIKQRDIDHSDEQGLSSKVNLVDLAGSERADSTGAQGQTLKEGAAINKSLSALGNVINSLADLKKRNHHVPYRDSKLTRILEESLGGNCVTIMLAMVSPADYNYAESHSTLQFANRAKNIKNTTKKNEDENTKVIRELREEIALLRNSMTQVTGPGSVTSAKEVDHLEAMISDLQMAKKQTWDEKQRLSEMYEEERKKNLANKGILDLVMDTLKREQHEAQERLKQLYEEKEQLSETYKEGRKRADELKEKIQQKMSSYNNLLEEERNDKTTQSHLNVIRSLKENLKHESKNLKVLKEKLKDIQEKIKLEKEGKIVQSNLLQGNMELWERIKADERDKLARENSAVLREKLEGMKLEIEEEKAELKLKVAQGADYKLEEYVKMEAELIELRAQTSMSMLQIEKLEKEKLQLSQDLRETFKRHREDIEQQELQYFQVFKAYRKHYEEQKLVIEQRFRGLLEESIQDAIYLAAMNSQLKSQIQKMRQEMNSLKDLISQAGIPAEQKPSLL